jgi:hypothetical protein
MRTTASTARVSHTFTGRGVALVMATGLNGGKAEVYLDGVLVQTLDLYTCSQRVRRIVYSAAFETSGSHTVGLRRMPEILGARARQSVDRSPGSG